MTLLFDNLRILLNDICTFLQKEINQGRLSDDAKNIATDLLSRSSNMMIQATQTEIIDSAGYLDMKKKHYIDEYMTSDTMQSLSTDNDKVYSIPEEIPDNTDENKNNPEIVQSDCVSPYSNTPVNELNVVTKSGFLTRKEYTAQLTIKKMLHIFEFKRKYFVVIIDKWLMFYQSNKRGKAIDCFDLTICHAKDTDDSTGSFILNIKDKTFLITADSRKEKLQWLTIINDISKSEETTLETPTPNKTKDQIKHESLDSDTSNIYNDIDEDNKVTVHQSPTKLQTLPSQSTQRSSIPEYMNQGEETYDFLPAHQEISQISPSLPPPRVQDDHKDEDIYDLVSSYSKQEVNSNPGQEIDYPSHDDIYDIIQDVPRSTNTVNIEIAIQQTDNVVNDIKTQKESSSSEQKEKSPKKLKQKLQQKESKNKNSGGEDKKSPSKRSTSFGFRSKKKL